MNGVIYELYRIGFEESYIGSTKKLRKRMNDHKYNCNNVNSNSYNYPVYQFIRCNGGFENWQFRIIESGIFDNSIQLTKKEKFYIKSLKPKLNRNIPCREIGEYYIENKEDYKKYYQEHRKEILEYKKNNPDIIAYQKEYYLKNNESIKKSRVEKITCKLCNCEVSRSGMLRHQKTEKCKKNRKKNNLLDFFNPTNTNIII